MEVKLADIQHHQRIVITGPKAHEILELSRKTLSDQKREYDIITPNEEKISDAPVALMIVPIEAIDQWDPHVVLIDEVPDEKKNIFLQIADQMPKSGTLVYNTADKNAEEIGAQERADVHRVPYAGGKTIEAAKALLQRLGIREAEF
jgi:hypothetical protein